MKYIRTAIAEQETTVNILYNEQIIRVYSSRVEVIKILTKLLGEPTVKYKKSKSYWSGANWDIGFSDSKKIEKILLINSFVDSDIEIIKQSKKIKTVKNNKKNSNEKIQTTNKKNEKTKTNSKPSTKTNKNENTRKSAEKVKSAKKVTNQKEKVKNDNLTKKDTKKAQVKTKKKKVENDEFVQFSLI